MVVEVEDEAFLYQFLDLCDHSRRFPSYTWLGLELSLTGENRDFSWLLEDKCRDS